MSILLTLMSFYLRLYLVSDCDQVVIMCFSCYSLMDKNGGPFRSIKRKTSSNFCSLYRRTKDSLQKYKKKSKSTQMITRNINLNKNN